MRRVLSSVLCVLLGSAFANAQVTNVFTYQGQLTEGGQAPSGAFDLRFRLFDQPTDGTPIGGILCVDNLQVVDGRFTVELNFGSVFNGASRFLQVEVRPDTGAACDITSGFTVLTPRQRLTATPHASYALTAATAATASNASLFNNQLPTFYTNAANLSAGTLPDARLSSNISTLSGAQTFSGVKTFSTAPAFTSAGSPFSVASSSRVTNLNADLLDGLNSTAFAGATHSHDASAIVSGLLADARIPAGIPRTAITNVFTDTQVINVPSQTPLTLIGSNSGGTWVNLQNTGGGRTWNLIATGTSNSEGAGKLLIRDQSALAVRMALDSAGRVGIGTTAPSSLVELAQADAMLRVRNTNDPGGGFIQDTFSTLQLGMYNPTATGWGAVPANSQRSMFGIQNTGRVGTLVNSGGSPIWRNTIDDGNGNAVFSGTIAAANTPRIKHVSGSAFLGVISNDSRTLIENITVTVPAAGFLHIHCHAVLYVYTTTPTASTVILELKETTGPEVLVKESPLRLSPPLSGPDMSMESSQVINHVIPVDAGTRSYKLRVRHTGLGGGGGGTLQDADITITYYPSSL
ncbi:MAG: hypothetical protein SFY69_05280 [Planctomycetota bacterium]|nr:hypothetical protein [Planctomycetota bacterium]